MLVDQMDHSDEFAEIEVVGVRKDAVEHTRALTIDIVEKFPSLIATRDLLLWVPGCPAK